MNRSAAGILNAINEKTQPHGCRYGCRYQDIFKLCDNCTDDAFAVQFNAYISGMSVSQVKRLLSEPNTKGLLPIHLLIRRNMIKGTALLLEWAKAFDLDYKVGPLTIMDAVCDSTRRISDQMLRIVLTHTDDPDNQFGKNFTHPIVIFSDSRSSIFALLDSGATVEACFERHPHISKVKRDGIVQVRADWLAERLVASHSDQAIQRPRARGI